MINYNKYELSKDEKVKYFLCAYGVIFIISYLFYKNVFISFVVGGVAIYYLKIKKDKIIKDRKRKLLLQFRDMLYLLSTALGAGYSVDNALKKTKESIDDLYHDTNSMISKEIDTWIKNISLNKSLDSMLVDFSKRTNLEDVGNFVEVFITCKNTGGNLNEVIRNTSIAIKEKIDIEEEISILIAQKKLEQNIIILIPIVMMFILTFMAADYIEPLHNTIQGSIVITLVIGLIGVASFIGKSIMDIKV